MSEELTPIKGYEGIYSIMRDGKIWVYDRIVNTINGYGKKMVKRTIKAKWLNPTRDKDGYLTLSLTKNGKLKSKKVHRLVAQTFIPNLENQPQVNHINGIKDDNRVENLEWCDHTYNMRHAYLFNIIKRKITNKQIQEIKDNHKHVRPYKEKIWEKYNISKSTYYYILEGYGTY